MAFTYNQYQKYHAGLSALSGTYYFFLRKNSKNFMLVDLITIFASSYP